MLHVNCERDTAISVQQEGAQSDMRAGMQAAGQSHGFLGVEMRNLRGGGVRVMKLIGCPAARAKIAVGESLIEWRERSFHQWKPLLDGQHLRSIVFPRPGENVYFRVLSPERVRREVVVTIGVLMGAEFDLIRRNQAPDRDLEDC